MSVVGDALASGRLTAVATIYDVAERAGVSPATVSRVLNGRPVSPDKERLVRAAARELRFVPNRTARTLRRQLSEVVALVIPDIENPFFTSIARGVADTAQKAGYSVVLCNTDDDAANEQQFIDIALSENMAGVIVASATGSTDVSALLRRGRAVVAIDRPIPTADVDTVVLDNVDAGRQVTRVLWRAGFRDIACITGPAEVVTAVDRGRGWRLELDELGGTAADARLLHADFRVGGGRARMLELLDAPQPPDAVVAGNNLVGVGALQVLAERGLTPRQVGLAVIGDLPFAALAPDAVPVVHLPTRALGATAGRLLLERLAAPEGPGRQVVIRGSLRPVPPEAGDSVEPAGCL